MPSDANQLLHTPNVLNQTRNGTVYAQAETDMGNNKILVVEDIADYREMIMLFLRRSATERLKRRRGWRP